MPYFICDDACHVQHCVFNNRRDFLTFLNAIYLKYQEMEKITKSSNR